MCTSAGANLPGGEDHGAGAAAPAGEDDTMEGFSSPKEMKAVADKIKVRLSTAEANNTKLPHRYIHTFRTRPNHGRPHLAQGNQGYGRGNQGVRFRMAFGLR